MKPYESLKTREDCPICGSTSFRWPEEGLRRQIAIHVADEHHMIVREVLTRRDAVLARETPSNYSWDGVADAIDWAGTTGQLEELILLDQMRRLAC